MDPTILTLIPIISLSIPIIAIIMGIGIAAFSMALNYRKRKEMFTLYHQERMAAIEKGMELPPLPDAFFSENLNPAQRSGHRALLRGMILLFVGITLFGGFWYQERTDTGIYALVPAAVGLAYLIYYFTVGRKEALANAAAERAAEAGSIEPA